MLVGVFALLPAVLALCVPSGGWLPILWLVAGCAAWSLEGWTSKRKETSIEASPVEWQRMSVRFAVSAAFLTLGVGLLAPGQLFALPRDQPWLWLAIVVLYPVLSVLPQEILYRRFFFHWARRLGRSERWTTWGSAVAFGAMHALYWNIPAVVLTLIGGWFFADTYRRTHSLRLVCFEHALYGSFIFTLGLGHYFSPAR